nr:hypothetical protein [Tanacetum cinerariifolium]
MMPFTVNVYYNGVFVEKPFKYTHGDFKLIDDVDFDGLLYVQMYDIIRRVVLVSPICLFFKLVDQPLVCLKPLKTYEDVDHIAPEDQSVKPPFKCNVDDYARSTHENLKDLKDNADFEVEGTFIRQTDDPTANLGGRFILKKMTLNMTFLIPSLKPRKTFAIPHFILQLHGINANQLLNDYSKLLVYCGRDVGEGKCVTFKRKKPKDKHDHAECTNYDIGDSSSTPDHAECSSKPATKKNGRTSQAMKESLSNKKEYEKKRLQKSVPYPFRLSAFWMSTEKSF